MGKNQAEKTGRIERRSVRAVRSGSAVIIKSRIRSAKARTAKCSNKGK